MKNGGKLFGNIVLPVILTLTLAVTPAFAEELSFASAGSTQQEEQTSSGTDEQGALAEPTAEAAEEEALTAAASSSGDNEVETTVTYCQTSAREVLQYVNDFRTSGTGWLWNDEENTTNTTGIHVPALTYDYGLEKIAMQRAAECAFYFSLNHYRPTGEKWWTAVDSDTYGDHLGENLALGYTSAEDVFNGWKEENENYNGQGHRRNMLSGNFTTIGIACVKKGGYTFWAQEFGSKKTDTDPTAAIDKESSVKIPVSSSLVDSYSGTVNEDPVIVLRGKTKKIPGAKISVTLKEDQDSDETGKWKAIILNSIEVTTGFTWEVDDTSLATVSGDTITGVKAGNTKLRATLPIGVSASATLKVYEPVSSLSLNKSSTTINVGKSETLTAAAKPENATDKSVTWSSSDPSIATVDSNGKITGKAPGTAVITATAKYGGATAKCNVTIWQPVTGVSLNKTSTKIWPKASETLKATVSPANASNKAVTWSSSNTSVAKVDAN
jgi:uncharacterized protein YkwD